MEDVLFAFLILSRVIVMQVGFVDVFVVIIDGRGDDVILRGLESGGNIGNIGLVVVEFVIIIVVAIVVDVFDVFYYGGLPQLGPGHVVLVTLFLLLHLHYLPPPSLSKTVSQQVSIVSLSYVYFVT